MNVPLSDPALQQGGFYWSYSSSGSSPTGSSQGLGSAPGTPWQFSQSNTTPPPLPAGQSNGSWKWVSGPSVCLQPFLNFHMALYLSPSKITFNSGADSLLRVVTTGASFLVQNKIFHLLLAQLGNSLNRTASHLPYPQGHLLVPGSGYLRHR